MEAKKNPARRTITLTGRPPVNILEADWPVLADHRELKFDNQYEFQANRKSSLLIRVRRHDDGRALVYGVYDYSTNHQGAEGAAYKGGELVPPGGDIVAAIERVAADLAERIGEDHFGLDAIEAGQKCIADLPPVEL